MISKNRTDRVLDMQITIANCMKQEWEIDFCTVSDILDKYDLLPYKDLEPENLPKQYFFGTDKALEKLRFKQIRREIVG